MNIAEILEEHAANHGGHDAIVEPRRRITFAGLNDAAIRAADRLSRCGLSAGMRALVLGPISIDLYSTVIGLFRLGGTAVFVDPSAGSDHLERALARVRPDAFIGAPRAHLLRLTSRGLRRIPLKMVIGWNAGGFISRSSIEPCAEQTPAIITFTSGTTGVPKAVVRTHGFLRAQHRAIVENMKIERTDVDLTTLPIFVLANLASGITSVIPDADLRKPGSIDGARVVTQIQRCGVTRTVASPALLERVVQSVACDRSRMLSLRKVFTGGAPVFPRALDALADAAPNASIVAVYGSTEAEPIATLDREEITDADRIAMQQGAGLLAGRTAASLQVRIVRDHGSSAIRPTSSEAFEDEVLPAGEVGEIVVSGAHVVSGYLDGLGNDETKIVAGRRVWHRTGDAGYFDLRGRLWLLGRCSARIDDAYGVAYPLGVECAASHVAGVRRSALVLHHGRRLLVVETDVRLLKARDVLLNTLAWAHLSDVIVVRRIPVDRRHNAKVDLAALRSSLDTHWSPRLSRTDVLSSPGLG